MVTSKPPRLCARCNTHLRAAPFPRAPALPTVASHHLERENAMNTSTSNRNADYNRLLEAARERAAQLRKQAIRDAWSGAADAADRALRSAARLGRSLSRHTHLRAQPRTEG
jgi:hypothetical protein